MENNTMNENSAPEKTGTETKSPLKKFLKKFLIFLGVVIVVLLGINEAAKFIEIKKTEYKLSYVNQLDVFDLFSYKPVTFKDKENGLKYEFYGVSGDMIFNGDGTVTFSRKYNRNSCRGGDAKWTGYVETTESYKVAFSGFFYPFADVGIKTENGDFYEFSFDYDSDEERIDDVYLFSNRTYFAPVELKDMATETVYEEKKYSSGGSSYGSGSDDDYNFSDYLKENDPDLYNSIVDRYESLQ